MPEFHSQIDVPEGSNLPNRILSILIQMLRRYGLANLILLFAYQIEHLQLQLCDGKKDHYWNQRMNQRGCLMRETAQGWVRTETLYPWSELRYQLHKQYVDAWS